jgi:hypothetical protein
MSNQEPESEATEIKETKVIKSRSHHCPFSGFFPTNRIKSHLPRTTRIDPIQKTHSKKKMNSEDRSKEKERHTINHRILHPINVSGGGTWSL